jgi:hypothetical protein
MIDKTNEDYDNFFTFMRNTFEEVFIPIHKRKNIDEVNDNNVKDILHDDLVYK